MTRHQASLSRCIAFLFAAVGTQAGTIYTNTPNLAELTAGINNYATFLSAFYSDVTLPYTPTAATLAQGLRVVGEDGDPPIVVRFPQAVSQIRVFPSIDHLGWAPDGYQYAISGSNDGSHYTLLFDPTSVLGIAEPFSIGTFTGTAPFRVNNVLTPGAGPGGQVGYVADFAFSQEYQYFSFGSSSLVRGDNRDEELSAVGSPTDALPTHMPEPASYVMILIGSGLIGLRMTRTRTAG